MLLAPVVDSVFARVQDFGLACWVTLILGEVCSALEVALRVEKRAFDQRKRMRVACFRC